MKRERERESVCVCECVCDRKMTRIVFTDRLLPCAQKVCERVRERERSVPNAHVCQRIQGFRGLRCFFLFLYLIRRVLNSSKILCLIQFHCLSYRFDKMYNIIILLQLNYLQLHFYFLNKNSVYTSFTEFATIAAMIETMIFISILIFYLKWQELLSIQSEFGWLSI